MRRDKAYQTPQERRPLPHKVVNGSLQWWLQDYSSGDDTIRVWPVPEGGGMPPEGGGEGQAMRKGQNDGWSDLAMPMSLE